MDSCTKHPHEPGSALCGRCGAAWCDNCLVYSFGSKKPPFCMECAMFAGGVRSAAARPAMPKRELKKLMKQVKAEAKAGRAAEPVSSEAVATEAPAPARTSEWENPWWEDREGVEDREPTYAD